MALRFGGTWFYSYHIHFASQAAGRIQPFNQGTYWGTLDSEPYCHIFAACTSLSCELCGAPSHPITLCMITVQTPCPRPASSCKNIVLNRFSPAPPPPVIPRPADIWPTLPNQNRRTCHTFLALQAFLQNPAGIVLRYILRTLFWPLIPHRRRLFSRPTGCLRPNYSSPWLLVISSLSLLHPQRAHVQITSV